MSNQDEKDLMLCDVWFRHHSPISGGNQAERYSRLREAGGVFARAVIHMTPPSADRTAALRKIREAVFTANAAIACCEDGTDGLRSVDEGAK